MELNINSYPNTTKEWEALLIEEMINQGVPKCWREVVIVFMAGTLGRILAMYKWFIGSRDIPYNTLTMVTAMIRIQQEIPKKIKKDNKMYNIYLNEKDMRIGSKYSVIAHLNEAANDNLLKFLENLSNGVGNGYNYSTGYFWDELDDYDKVHTNKFEGLMIETESGEETNASLEEIVYYLNILVGRCQLSSSERERAKEIIDHLENKNR